ncbi:glycosyltransferase [Lentzea pudingi]|uniref:glycosyltransferase n=1 Tax=Lentzea pudingi TaxID=1789439 RepID=UPI00166C0C0B|nr:glycosyltransferase [Lentzea pudingi]
MKIAMISLRDNPLTALHDPDAVGQRRYVARLSAELHRLGHQLTIYTRRADARLPHRMRVEHGFEVVHVSAGPARKLSPDDVATHIGEFARFLNAQWTADAPDVVHAHHWTSGLAAVLGARRTGIPVLQSCHGLVGGESGEIERLVGRSVAGVAATSSHEADELARLGVRRSRISVVPWGVDTRTFTPEGPATARTGRLRLLVAGDLNPQAGVDDLITALAVVSGTELVVAGGPDRHSLAGNAEHERLRALAARHAVTDRVGFLGHVPHSQMPALIRSADVVVCPQRHSSSGAGSLEAMACGVPVVAAAAGGLAEAVVHEVTGLLVPPHTPMVLARALRALLGDELRRQELGTAGRDRVLVRHAWDRVAPAVVRAYERVSGPEVITAQRRPPKAADEARRALTRDERGE